VNGTEALISLIRTFEKAGVPYMIVGSYSSNFYGIPRSTKDADVVVNVAGVDWGMLIPQHLQVWAPSCGGRGIRKFAIPIGKRVRFLQRSVSLPHQ